MPELSDRPRVPWDVAARFAQHISAELTPLAVRVKTVGSIRRRKPIVHDIELLIEPPNAADLFGAEAPFLDHIRAKAAQWGDLVKNGDRYIQVAGRLYVLGEGERPVNIDLFLCHPPAQWGSLLAVRTGPKELGELAVTRMKFFDLQHERGHCVNRRTGELMPTPTEEEFFGLARLPCLPPSKRHTPAAFQPTEEVSRVRRSAPF
jgi:DNA polymerase/3'-5' exonuclease PolX